MANPCALVVFCLHMAVLGSLTGGLMCGMQLYLILIGYTQFEFRSDKSRRWTDYPICVGNIRKVFAGPLWIIDCVIPFNVTNMEWMNK
jgi:hypothetical protein